MKLVVNGEQADSKAETLQELLGELRIKPERVAVEVNLSIIKKSDYGSCRLKDGDRIEIVNFVGGGEQLTVVSKYQRVKVLKTLTL